MSLSSRLTGQMEEGLVTIFEIAKIVIVILVILILLAFFMWIAYKLGIWDWILKKKKAKKQKKVEKNG